MKFFAILAMLTLSGLALAQSTVSPSTSPSATTTPPTTDGTAVDSKGTMNSDANMMDTDATKTHQQKMEEAKDLERTNSTENIDSMNTVPSQTPSPTTTTP